MTYDETRRTLTARPNVSAIRMAMRFRRMTKADLARASKLSKGTVGNVLNGTRRSFNPETANAIADALDLPAGDLFVLEPLRVAVTRSVA
ncbi:helix-turn-helix domain-containing protein [Brachybacterium hainanense]|uniref:Helix-turn-helix domain-containing protein n=1 Tax=Brachybacterium hainanense TaxID=1541174 RepID=A0ABV6R9N3_9MICO